MKKRIFNIFLAACLVALMLPAVAFSKEGDVIASVDGTGYSTLKAAFEVAQADEGKTIVLEESYPAPAEDLDLRGALHPVTLDLNGNTLGVTASIRGLQIDNMTIIDSDGTGSVFSYGEPDAVAITSTGNAVLDGICVVAGKGAAKAAAGTLNIVNCYITGTVFKAENAEVWITGGFFKAQPALGFMAEGYLPAKNTDTHTCAAYPCKVSNQCVAAIVEPSDDFSLGCESRSGGQSESVASAFELVLAYESLADALNDVDVLAEQTVVLLKDVVEDAGFVIPEGVVLDLNHHAFNVESAGTNDGTIILHQENAAAFKDLLRLMPGAYAANEELRVPDEGAQICIIPKGTFMISKFNSSAPKSVALQMAIDEGEAVVWNSDLHAGMQLKATFSLILGGNVQGSTDTSFDVTNVTTTNLALSDNIVLGNNEDGATEAELFIKSYPAEWEGDEAIVGTFAANGHTITLNKSGRLVVSADVAFDKSVLISGVSGMEVASAYDEATNTIVYTLKDAASPVNPDKPDTPTTPEQDVPQTGDTTPVVPLVIIAAVAALLIAAAAIRTRREA